MSDKDLDVESDLVNLGGLDLEVLRTLRDTALAQAIHRVLQSVENPEEATLGFQQFI